MAADGEHVLVRFSWQDSPHPLGYRFVAHEPFDVEWGTDDWADQAAGDFDEELATGLVGRASRTLVDGVIELGRTDWPGDERFYPSVSASDDPRVWEALDSFAADGLDPAPAVALRDAATLIAWVTSSVNTRRGGPYVGHVGVARIDDETAEIAFSELIEGLPPTVLLDLCHTAAQVASWNGAETVRTSITDPVLDLLGFTVVDGVRQVDTRFLDRDFAAPVELQKASRRWKAPRRRGPRTFGTFSYVGT